MALVVKNLPANAGDIGDVGSASGSGRSPGGGHGSPLRYSWLENPTDRGVWWAAVHGLTKSRTWLIDQHLLSHFAVIVAVIGEAQRGRNVRMCNR